MKNTRSVAVLMTMAVAGCGFLHSTSSQDGSTAASEPNLVPYQLTIGRIAEAIERLNAEYPQLADFSSRNHCDRTKLVIDYGHNTHRALRRGGWTSGVPNPDEDGVWFYIDFHHPASQRQIHTQPMVPRYRYEDKKVMFLILEGEETKSISAAIFQILRDNGVEPDDG
jgi:hypothetical protein